MLLSFVGANLSITARAITVTADSKTKTYGGADPALTYQVTTGVLVAGDSFSGSLSRVAGEDVGSYAIQQGTLALSGNYALTFVGANLSITKATPVITWSTPAAITYPAALSGAQLNASANVPGTFVYTPPTGTVLNAGPGQTLHVDFTPSDTTNYTTAVKNVLITVLKASQAITFAAPGPKTFGDPPVPVGATGGSSGQPVTFQTMTPAICSASPNGVNAATVTINAVGQCTVRASQAGTSNYEPAADVDRSFSVATWTAQGFHQPVGIPNSVFAPATTELLAGPPASAAWNSAKGGSTIPLKFNVFAAGVERTNTSDIVGFSLQQLPACNGTSYEDPLDIETAGATVLRYDGVAGSGGQFIQNWKTPAVKAEQCYRVAVTLKDQSVLYTFVKLKK
ncbi:MAG TPA: MBG domain-containing protein [Vicinamibacterales bacterium]|nr:MBG domain-containing protein [Vicinamibacterales bacterium]